MALPAAVQSLETWQWGAEATKGIEVPSTSKIITHDGGISLIEQGLVYRPSLAKSLLIGDAGNELTVMRQSGFNVSNIPLCYEQAPNWASLAVQGGVSPTGTNPYTYVHTRAPGTDPALKSWTLERRISDASNNVDVTLTYAMLSQIKFSYVENEVVRLSATGFGRVVNANAITAAQALPTPEFVPAALTKVFIDTSWAGLGGTQITGQVIGWELTFDTGALPKMTADGRTSLDFTTYLLNPTLVKLTCKLTCLVNTTRLGTERTAAAANTLRAVRIQSDGNGSRQMQWDFLCKHTLPDVLELGEQEGQHVVVFDLTGTNDSTNYFAMTVVNLISTMI